MVDDLKFGPEWLRALTDGNTVSSPPHSPGCLTKFKLAEYRYGREEMLALFVPDTFIQENVKQFSPIYVDKIQHPLAFVPLNEDEQRLMAQGVNSTAVLRITNKVPIQRGGKVGSDRGRGRGRGRVENLFTSRDSEDGMFGRGRAVRSESWEEREERHYEKASFGHCYQEDGAVMSRRELSRSFSSENWRETRKDANEEVNWRKSSPKEREKYIGNPVNWRDKEHPLILDERDIGDQFYKRNKFRNSESYEEDEELPEWSITETEDDIGTFDASGAFLSLKGMVSKEKYPEIRHEIRDKISEDSLVKMKEIIDQPIKRDSQIITKNNILENEISKLSGNSISDRVTQNKNFASEKDLQRENHFNEKTLKEDDDMCVDISDSNDNVNKDGSKTCSGAASSISTEELSETLLLSSTIDEEKTKPQLNSIRNKQSYEVDGSKMIINNQLEDDHTYCQNVPAAFSQDSKCSALDKNNTQELFSEISDNVILEKLKSGDEILVNDNNACNKSLLKEQFPSGIEGDTEKWFYRDPQGELQGPFSAPEMAEWFSAGYFTMNLMVKRGCDEHFFTLGELIKRWGRVPFLPGTNPDECSSNSNAQEPSNPSTPDIVSSNHAQAVGGTQVFTQQEQMKAYILQQQQAAFLHQQAIYMRQFQMQQSLQMLQQNEKYIHSNAQHCADLHLLLKQPQQEVLPVIKDTDKPPGSLNVHNISENVPNVMQHSGSKDSVDSHVKQGNDSQECSDTSKKDEPQKLSSDQIRSPSHTVIKEKSIAATIWEALKKNPSQGNWTKPNSVWDIEHKGKVLSLEDVESEELNSHHDSQITAMDMEKRGQAISVEEIEKEQLCQTQKKEIECNLQSGEVLDKEDLNRVPRQSLIMEEDQNKANEQGENRKNSFEEPQVMEKLENKETLQYNDRIDGKKQYERTAQHNKKSENSKKKQKTKEIQKKHLKVEEERKKNQDAKISKHQGKQEEHKVQQKEMIVHLHQDQLSNIKLPEHAQWGTYPSANIVSNIIKPNLLQIQEMEVEEQRQKKDMIQDAKIKQEQDFLELKCEDKMVLSWARRDLLHEQPKLKSLVEIQQEQAQQHLKDIQQKQIKNTKQQVTVVTTGAVWNGSVNPCYTSKPSNKLINSSGFWDDFAHTSNKQKSSEINKHFPSLSTGISTASQKTKQTKIKKEEELVQKLFKPDIPSDDFTNWCEETLQSFETSVDVPTFINFLFEVDSPYEVHDYARQFLGESRKTTEFAKLFIERREKYNNKNPIIQKKEINWMTSTKSIGNTEHGNNINLRSVDDISNRKGKKSKKSMQRIDNSILGFTCTAATERVNVGEIENL